MTIEIELTADAVQALFHDEWDAGVSNCLFRLREGAQNSPLFQAILAALPEQAPELLADWQRWVANCGARYLIQHCVVDGNTTSGKRELVQLIPEASSALEKLEGERLGSLWYVPETPEKRVRGLLMLKNREWVERNRPQLLSLSSDPDELMTQYETLLREAQQLQGKYYGSEAAGLNPYHLRWMQLIRATSRSRYRIAYCLEREETVRILD